MATQDATAIAFSAAQKQLPFKLLELPPEILQLLESESPPTLILKSGTASTQSGLANAALCVPGGKKYRVQQKNSSNPIMLIEPCISYTEAEGDLGSVLPSPGVRAICTIEDTLELYPEDSEPATVTTKVNKWHEKFAKGRAGEAAKK